MSHAKETLDYLFYFLYRIYHKTTVIWQYSQRGCSQKLLEQGILESSH